MKQSRSYYPNQIQLRLIEIVDRNNIKVQVYERATSGDGGCSNAVISTAYELGLIDRKVTVHTKDSEIEVELMEGGSVKVHGTVEQNTSVVLSKKLREQLRLR